MFFETQPGPVGAAGGYDGREGGLSDTARFAAFGSSYRFRVIQIHRVIVHRGQAPTGSALYLAKPGPVGAAGGYDGREGGLSDTPRFAAFGSSCRFGVHHLCNSFTNSGVT